MSIFLWGYIKTMSMQIPKQENENQRGSIFSGLNKQSNTMSFYEEEHGYEHYAIEEMRGITPQEDHPIRKDENKNSAINDYNYGEDTYDDMYINYYGPVRYIFSQSKKPVYILSDGTPLYEIPRITKYFNFKNKSHKEAYDEEMKKALSPVSDFIVKLYKLNEILTKMNNGEELALSDIKIDDIFLLHESFFIAYNYFVDIQTALEENATDAEQVLFQSVEGGDYYANKISLPIRILLSRLDEYAYNIMDEPAKDQLLLKQRLVADGQSTAVVDFYKETISQVNNDILPYLIAEKFGDANLGYTFNDMSVAVLKTLNEYIDNQQKMGKDIIEDKVIVNLIGSGILSNKSKFGKFISAKGMEEGITCYILEREETRKFIERSKISDIKKLFDLFGENEELYYVFLSRPILFNEINEINVDTLSKANEQGELGGITSAVGDENETLIKKFHSAADIYTESDQPVATISGFNGEEIKLYEFPKVTKFFDLYNPKHVEKISPLINQRCEYIKNNFFDIVNSKLDAISENLLNKWSNGEKAENTKDTGNIFNDYQTIAKGIQPIYNYLETAYKYYFKIVSSAVDRNRSMQETDEEMGRNIMRTDGINSKFLSNITELIRDIHAITLSLIPEGNAQNNFYERYLNVSNANLPLSMEEYYTEEIRLKIELFEKLSGSNVNDADDNFDSDINKIYKIPVEILRVLNDKAQNHGYVEKIKTLLSLGILNGTAFSDRLVETGLTEKIIVGRILDQEALMSSLKDICKISNVEIIKEQKQKQKQNTINLFNTLSRDSFMHDLYFRYPMLIEYSMYNEEFVKALDDLIVDNNSTYYAYNQCIKFGEMYFINNFLDLEAGDPYEKDKEKLDDIRNNRDCIILSDLTGVALERKKRKIRESVKYLVERDYDAYAIIKILSNDGFYKTDEILEVMDSFDELKSLRSKFLIIAACSSSFGEMVSKYFEKVLESNDTQEDKFDKISELVRTVKTSGHFHDVTLNDIVQQLFSNLVTSRVNAGQILSVMKLILMAVCPYYTRSEIESAEFVFLINPDIENEIPPYIEARYFGLDRVLEIGENGRVSHKRSSSFQYSNGEQMPLYSFSKSIIREFFENEI